MVRCLPTFLVVEDFEHFRIAANNLSKRQFFAIKCILGGTVQNKSPENMIIIRIQRCNWTFKARTIHVIMRSGTILPQKTFWDYLSMQHFCSNFKNLCQISVIKIYNLWTHWNVFWWNISAKLLSDIFWCWSNIPQKATGELNRQQQLSFLFYLQYRLFGF